MFKKSIIALDICAMATIIFAPALFVPSYFFAKDVGAVAIIGGDGPASVFLTDKAMIYGNYLFPLFVLLIGCNLYCLFTYFRKRLVKKQF